MSETLGLVLGFLGLFITIVTSAIGVAAWITSRLSELKTDVKHAFLRIDALEKRADNQPTAQAARRRKK